MRKWAHNKKNLVPETCKVPRNPKQEPLLFQLSIVINLKDGKCDVDFFYCFAINIRWES